MSRFRDIWAKALHANRALALRQGGAEAIFDGLIFEYPKDGMVLYERAEAHEYLGHLDRAEADYRRAAGLFPLPHWKAVARTKQDSHS